MLDILYGSLNSQIYIHPEQKFSDEIEGWLRPTLNWSLECERRGLTRQYAIDTVTHNSQIVPSIGYLEMVALMASILSCIELMLLIALFFQFIRFCCGKIVNNELIRFSNILLLL